MLALLLLIEVEFEKQIAVKSTMEMPIINDDLVASGKVVP